MLWRDIRYGLRTLLKNPGFSAAVLLVLALGIGVNSAMFSALTAILLQKFPFAEPERVVTLWEVNQQKGFEQSPVSAATFADWRARTKVFEQMSLYDSDSKVLTGAGDPERLLGARVSANFFSLLGVQAARGSAALPEDGQVNGTEAVVLGHDLWHRRFNSDPSLVGKIITLDSKLSTVVGVLPPDFRFLGKADVWSVFPLSGDALKEREARYVTAVARLRRGVTVEQAQSEMEIVSHGLQQDYPATNVGWGARVVPLRDYLVSGVRSSLLILFGAVTFVLLLACTNVASMLLARLSARRKEFAVRTALGATRLHLIRQLLVECVLLALLGGTLGLLLAYWCVGFIAAFVPETVSRGEITLDGRVLGFTLTVSVLCGLLSGIAPVLQTSKLSLGETLKENSRGATGGARHNRLRRLLVVAEVSLSLMLLVGAGLMIKSFLRLQQVNPGFNPDHVLAARISLPPSIYPDPTRRAAFFQQLLSQLETVPGVQSVGATTTLPLSGSSMNFRFSVEGQPAASGELSQAQYRAVSPGYFRTMGIPLREGRDVTERDGADALGVVVINETMARRLFPQGGALGKRLIINYGKPAPREVVGVVGDVKHLKLEEPPKPEMYVPYTQNPWAFMTVVLRTSVPPDNLASAVRNEVWKVDKNQPVDKFVTLDQVLYESVAQPRLFMLLLALFAVLAIVLSATGIYGVMSYIVSQRTHEIGVRLALGARPNDVLRMIVRQGMFVVLVGVVVGLLISAALTRTLSGLLYGVSATDFATFAEVFLLLVGVAFLACYLPARRATKVDPLIALRNE
jgi:putative ABC transport system permease protein